MLRENYTPEWPKHMFLRVGEGGGGYYLLLNNVRNKTTNAFCIACGLGGQSTLGFQTWGGGAIAPPSLPGSINLYL